MVHGAVGDIDGGSLRKCHGIVWPNVVNGIYSLNRTSLRHVMLCALFSLAISLKGVLHELYFKEIKNMLDCWLLPSKTIRIPDLPLLTTARQDSLRLALGFADSINTRDIAPTLSTVALWCSA